VKIASLDRAIFLEALKAMLCKEISLFAHKKIPELVQV
jgi:hypothetical protein